jgi:hypothetical protein
MRRHMRIWIPEHFGIIHRRRYPEAFINLPPLMFRGFLKVELIHAATGHVKRTLEFENLITDIGLNYVGSTGIIGYSFANELLYACGCGTGSTTPAVTDTGLVAEITPASSNRSTTVGSGADGESYVGGPPEYYQYTHVREFTVSQANGNLTEIGFFTATTSGTMWMRQLFKDGTGTPTTIVKTSSDILRVTYTLRVYPPASDATGTITISGSNYDWTLRPCNTNVSRAWGPGDGNNHGVCTGLGYWTAPFAAAYETDTLGARTGELSGSATAESGGSVAAYVTNNYYRDVTAIWAAGSANYATGIGGVEVWRTPGARYAFQEVFSPKFPKDNTKQLTLVHRHSWARYP